MDVVPIIAAAIGGAFTVLAAIITVWARGSRAKDEKIRMLETLNHDLERANKKMVALIVMAGSNNAKDIKEMREELARMLREG